MSLFDDDDQPKPYDFEELSRPLVKAFRFAFDLTRKNEDRDIPWSGPNDLNTSNHVALTPKAALSAEQLRYSKDEQGRDALEELIGMTLRVGIEQGHRLAMASDQIKTMKLIAAMGERALQEKKNDK